MNFEQLIQSINQTHTFFQIRASKQVDQNLTLRNWLIGYYLVEFEQNGQDRAIYGNKTIPTLAKKMAHVKGLSKRNFFLFKQFYQSYPSIVQTASAQLKDSGLVYYLKKCRQQLHNLKRLKGIPLKSYFQH